MEFSYRISEDDYVRGTKLRKSASRSNIARNVVFGLFILFCVFLLCWRVIQVRSSSSASDTTSSEPAAAAAGDSAQPQAQVDTRRVLIFNVAPFAGLAVVWTALIVGGSRGRLKRMYRKDPLFQNEFTVSVTPDLLSIQNPSGVSSQIGWNLVESWKEKNNLIVLIFRSKTSFLMNLSRLSDTEREDLRGILSSTISPK
jgi:hypothetical protein